MRHVLAIGVGAGDPDQITLEAVAALNRADVLFELERGTTELTLARRELVARHVRTSPPPPVVAVFEPARERTAADYVGAVEAWREARAAAWAAAIAEHVPADGTGAFLVWGDPSLYDSTIAVLEAILAEDPGAFTYAVIPGVSSLHALTARHRISLNRPAEAVQITTGRRLTDGGWPAGVQDVVVMLDGDCAFRHLREEPLDIYWGAYLGTHDELLRSGPLAEVADEIVAVRAAARARKGWVMDLYLLRRR